MRSNSRQEEYSWLKRQSKKKLIQLSGYRNIKHFMVEIVREDAKRSASRKEIAKMHLDALIRDGEVQRRY